jgi:hypothetical protein
VSVPAQIYAVKPPRGNVVHLHLPDYQLSNDHPRVLKDRQAMCGHGIWPNGQPQMTHELVPLADALTWTSLAPSTSDPRPSWRWCRNCLGHAVEVHALQARVLHDVLQVRERDLTEHKEQP